MIYSSYFLSEYSAFKLIRLIPFMYSSYMYVCVPGAYLTPKEVRTSIGSESPHGC